MVRALSPESDLVTHSASPRARLPHVMTTPPTRLRPRSTPIARLAPRPSSSSLVLRPRPSSFVLVPRLRPSPRSPTASLRSHQNTPNVAPAPWCAPQVRATIAPVSRVSCTSFATPRSSSLARGHSFSWTFRPFMDIFAPPPYVSVVHLYLRLVAPSFSSPSRSLCHRTSTTAAPFDLALAVAP